MASNFPNPNSNDTLYCEVCKKPIRESKIIPFRSVSCDECEARNADLLALMKITEIEDRSEIKYLRHPIKITEETINIKSNNDMESIYLNNFECNSCNEKNNACSYCKDCEDLLCKKCEYAHKRVTLTKNHVIVGIANNPDIRYQENNGLSSLQLPSAHSSILYQRDNSVHFHGQEYRMPFWKGRCTNINQTCRFAYLEERMLNLKIFINMKLQECKTEIDDINMLEKKMKDIMEEVNLKAINQSRIIHRIFNNYIRALEESERKLLHCVENIRQTKINKYQLEINKLRVLSLTGNEILNLKYTHLENSRIFREKMLNYYYDIRNRYSFQNMLQNDEIIFISTDASLLTAINHSGIITSNSFPPHCTASGFGISKVFCNRIAYFTVHTRNHLGDDILVGGEDIEATIETQANAISNADVMDCNNGKYIISYSPKREGQCSILVRIRGKNIFQSPFTVTVWPCRDYKPLGNALFMFGKKGEKDGEFKRPWGVCCDKDGNIIIADRKNNRIQIFYPNGSFKHKFGSQGSKPGKLNRPAGITVDCQNRLIVADKDNHRIQIFTLEGKFILTFGKEGKADGMFKYPYDVAVNSECKILVSDSMNQRIQLFDSNGTFLNKYGYEGHFNCPRGITFRREDNVLVTNFNNHRIVDINPSFEYSRFLGCEGSGARQFFRPQGILVDTKDNIIVADGANNCIKILNINGNLIHKFGTFGIHPGQMRCPSGICLSPGGLIIIVDSKNHRVQVF